MSRLVRGQVALEVGERLTDIGKKILKLHEYSGDALASQLSSIDSALGGELGRLEQLIKSCRGAKQSYPNYPLLRKTIADAGDAVYEIKATVEDIRGNVQMDGDWQVNGGRLLVLATELKQINFVPPEKQAEAV
jgi:hypothetical protein